MQSRTLGRNGPQVPVIGFGAWPIGGGMGAVDDRDAIRTLHHAIDVGVTFIDTAEAYRRSEEIIGQALAEWSGPRDQLFIATKVRGDDLSADHIVTAVERSLQALRVDVIDLLQAHSWDAYHPIEETMTAFDRLVGAGKVRYLGVSNFDADQMEAAWRIRPFQSDQPRYNLLDREAEQGVLPYCASQGIAVLAHSPLAKGLLTGKYRSEPKFPPDDERGQMARFSGAQFQQVLARTQALEAWAQAHDHSLTELAIAWVLANAAVTVCLCGAKTAAQVDDHVRAAAWTLSRSDLDEIDELLARA
jgi:aryl-alcohol dehydrogenase-like predicted oxidoreductase